MRPIRVLVVDDSAVVRRILTDVISEDPELEVAGTASNGRIALVKAAQLLPDLVTLDVEMPELDGLSTLKELRRSWPKLPVIMFSTLTERGAEATLDALSLGASDYLTKPDGPGNLGETRRQMREELLTRIKALVPRATPAAPARRLDPTRRATGPVTSASRHRPMPVGVVVIGVSTGGPVALEQVIPVLPGDFPVPVLVVQHMPPMFTRMLAERLDRRSELEVREAVGGERLGPGQVLIAPGGRHLVVRGAGPSSARAFLTDDPPENSCRPAVDPLFRTATAVFGAGVLAVVLTGMGYDGTNGARAVYDTGGQVVVQDQATSVVWGMPGAVVANGTAHDVVPLDRVADVMVERVRRGHVAFPAVAILGGQP